MGVREVVAVGLCLPFLGTALGAVTVFLCKKGIGKKIRSFLLGFAAGVMVAASVWSLLLPAIEMSVEIGGRVLSWVAPAVGFLCGVVFLILLDLVLPVEKRNSCRQLILALTVHNLPEGMAVGVALAGFLRGDDLVGEAGVLALVIGIAVQNYPEGAIVSFPLAARGMRRRKACLYGVLSGIAEPIGAVLMIFLTELFTPLLPYILAFAAGAMVHVTVKELIPSAEAEENPILFPSGVAVGFVLMMILDVAL